MTRPIVMLSLGRTAATVLALYQAKLRNPRSTVCLISEKDYFTLDYVRYFPLNDYLLSATDFERACETSSMKFDDAAAKFHIQRWFIIHDFLTTHDFTSCFIMDQDVLLYCDISVEAERFSQYDMTLSRGMSGHSMFINTSGVLHGFLEFLNQTLLEPDSGDLRNIIEMGGFTGKNCLEYYYTRMSDHSLKIGDTDIVLEDRILNHSLWDEPLLEYSDTKISLSWEDGVPFGRSSTEGRKVRMSSLHFQGRRNNHLVDVFSSLTIKPPALSGWTGVNASRR